MVGRKAGSICEVGTWTGGSETGESSGKGQGTSCKRERAAGETGKGGGGGTEKRSRRGGGGGDVEGGQGRARRPSGRDRPRGKGGVKMKKRATHKKGHDGTWVNKTGEKPDNKGSRHL